ncbi:MAG: protein phosphatase 2C domain-containing protein, partial [Oscillospiraceae bacterium]|nr:protein phosphatase 2C domain-containing protein [Oscillospiraceae bacterium]
MYVVGKTDIGNFREENQDKFQIATIGDSSAFAVVCDGMGGAASGGLASEIASNAVYERISLSFRPEMEQKSIRTMLLSAISAANTIVYNKSVESKENAGMGTTCVTAVLHNNV